VGLIPGGLEYNIAKFSRNSREISMLEFERGLCKFGVECVVTVFEDED
jgi:hypothetical protein